MSDETIRDLISGVLAIVGAFLGWVLGRKKTDAEVMKIKAEARKANAEAIKADAEASTDYVQAAKDFTALVQASNEELRNAHRKALDEISVQSQQIVNYELTIRALDRRMTEFEGMKMQVERLQGRVIHLETERRELFDRIEKLEQQKANLEIENERFRFRISELETEIKSYRKQVSTLERELQDYKGNGK
jgi:chromosome segregation ATPase